MKELAADLGVSTASISVALRGKPGISEETRIRILKEARRRGYDMSRLSGQQPKEVIQIIDYTYYINNDDPRQAFSYYGQFVDAAAAAITKRGYTPAGPLPGALGEKGSPGPAAGVILLGAKLMPQQVQPYIKENIPCVISGAILDDLPVTTIAHDNGFGIRSAIDHLYELGHRRIGYILSITGPIGQSRYDAFLAGIKDLELNAGEVMDMRSPDHFVDADGIFEAVCAAFKDSRPQATAFVCDNDYASAALMKGLRSLGLTPGKDISVTGFDDQPFSSLLEPALTSVCTFEQELADLCVEQLIYTIEHPGAPFRHIRLGTALKVRESTAAPAKT